MRIDAFVARDTGELMITECDATPDLTLSSPLYRQAQLSSTHGHMGPTQLLRALLKTGFEADRDLDSRVEAPADAGLMVGHSLAQLNYCLCCLFMCSCVLCCIQLRSMAPCCWRPGVL